MAKEDLFIMQGIVKEVLPQKMFRVEVNGNLVLCYLKGLLKKKKVMIIENDIVELEMTAYDLTRGKITKRVTK